MTYNVEFEMWKQFFESLTVTWLVDNYQYTKRETTLVSRRLYTYWESLIISWGDDAFYFNPPMLSSSVPILGAQEDIRLADCLPVAVINDFIRVIEL